jgi:hypothetical protein
MISRFVAYAFCAIIMWFQYVPGFSQEQQSDSEPKRSIVPYQRVFLPLELLDRLSDELREYEILGRPEWEQLFQPFLVNDETAKIFDRPPEVAHIYLSARLDGSNLVSDTSRVRFTRGSMTAESYRLEPWSLAINVNRPGESPLSSRVVRSSNEGGWGHDRNGTPVINLHRSTIENAIQPVDMIFPWTLRSLTTSKPTNLQFSFSLPRVSDSCLVLSLPKQATILDADASVTKIDDWSAQSKRFRDWADQADLELNRANLASDTRWLIELSGVDRCRFTISFDENSGVGATASNSLDHLVLEHVTEHDIDRFAISSTAKLEVSGDRNLWDRPFKFQLPAMSRIRSLTVAGRDVGWRSEDGMIVVLADDLRRIPATRESTTTVKISYLTFLADFGTNPTDSTSEHSIDRIEKAELDVPKVNLPLMQLEKSFVVKGLTTVRRSSDVQFSKFETTAKLRPFEKDLETTWEWSGYGPDFGVEIASTNSKREIRAITKVFSEDGEPKISVRLMVPGKLKLPITLELPKSWNNLSLVPITSSVPVVNSVPGVSSAPGVNSVPGANSVPGISSVPGAGSTTSGWSVVKDLQPSANRFFVYGGSVESVSSLDLQVQHTSKDSLAQMDFDANWLLVDGKPVPNKLVVESLPADWEVLGVRASDMVTANQLLPEEKSFIASVENGMVYLLRNHALGLAKVPPRLSSRATISSTLERVGESIVRAVFSIKIENAPVNDSIRIKYNAEQANVVILRMVDKQGALVNSDAPWSYNETDQSYNVLRIEPNQSIVLTADLAISDGRVRVPVPRIIDSAESDLELKVDPTLAIEDRGVGVWTYRDNGELIVSVFDDIESLDVLVDQGAFLKRSLVDESMEAHFDLTVDGQGIAKTFWRLWLSPFAEKEFRFRADDEWDFELANDALVNEEFTAWIDRKSDRVELCLRTNPSLSLERSAKFEFITKRKSALEYPEGMQPLEIQIPRLYMENGQQIRSTGALWFPKDKGWRARNGGQFSYGTSPYPIWENEVWKWRPWDIFHEAGDFSKNTRASDSMGSEPADVLSRSLFVENNLDIGWEKLSDVDGNGEVASLVLDNIAKLEKLRTVSFYIGIFMGAILVRWSKVFFCLGIAVLFASIVLLQSSQLEYYLAIANGFVWGGLLGAILWQIRMTLKRDVLTPTRQSVQSTIWDLAKGARSESLNKIGLVLMGVAIGFGVSKKVEAQDSVNGGSTAVPSVFIPFDSKEAEKVDQVLVPEVLLKRVRGNPGTPYTLKSAKHQLKLSSRGMTVEGVDQLVSTYEVYVHETSSVIEIPFKPSLQNFSRLLVDGREVTVIPALASLREFLTWTPDREGLRTITVYQVPRWVSRPAATVGTVSLDSREIDLLVLPASNAILEVDSDPNVAFDVESQGAVLDKESGRYVVHLGALPSIRGKVSYEPSTNTSITTRSQSDLTFDIELLLQSKTVLARTVLRAGAGNSLDKRLTIEADKMWEPVGGNWGNYRLVETRNGRFQFMRRYVFEWTSTGTDRAETESVIYWVLADKKAVEANLLFAECVEPVLRPRTLRFARVNRSEWSVEQITNWIPAISETESLNWPELKLIKADQRATSLRVPQTGAGALRRSSPTKNLQARIASRWVIESDKQLLASRIEFFGTSNTDLLELELPSGFSIEEVTNRNEKVKVHEREENGIRYAQLVAERTNWENYDFAIRLVKRDLSIGTSMPIPRLGVMGSQVMDQTVEVAASKVWRVELVSPTTTEKSMLGQGEEIGLVALMPSDQIRLIPRSPEAKGSLALSQKSSQIDGRVEVVIAGSFDVQLDSMAVAILEIPKLLSNRWRCSVPAMPTPCPLSEKAWLKIPLDRRSDSEEVSQFELSFSITPEEFSQISVASDWLRLVNPSEVEIMGDLSEMLVQLGREMKNDESNDRTEGERFFALESRIGPSDRLVNVSRYWFDTVDKSLQVKTEPSNVVQEVRWNGISVAWTQDSEILTIDLPVYPIGQWNEVEIVSHSPSKSIEDSNRKAFEVVGKDGRIYQIGAAMSLESELPTRFEDFSKVVRSVLTDVRSRLGGDINTGSAAAIHSEFWIKRLWEMAMQFDSKLSGLDAEKLVGLQAEIREAAKRLPVNVELVMSQDIKSIRKSSESSTERWRSMFGPLFVLTIVTGVLLFANSKRFPSLTLAFCGGAVWLLTGLWPVFAFVLVVVCVVALDAMWINRLNRRLVR